MKQIIQIVTDSSCDLPRRLVEQFKIAIVPLIVSFGQEEYADGELDVETFWDKAAGPHPPHTSQPSIGAFEERFEQLIAQGKQALCLTVTGKHSGTYNAARLAAQRFGDAVKVLDSASLSLGLGIQAMVAAQAARAGQSMQEILTTLKAFQERMQLTIVLNTMENLRRGGRADAFIAVADRMAQAFNIKPIINVVEGQLRLLGAARSFEGALRRAQRRVEKLGALEYLAVVHTRQQELAEKVAEQLAKQVDFPRAQIWIEETGAVLATHGGLGVIGILAVPR